MWTLFLMLVAQSATASLVYTPPSFKPSSARMVVVIHGCLQSAESMAFGTGWNQIAEANNLAILYPQVPKGSNGLDCWTWYLPQNQRADRGQLKSLADEVRSVKRKLNMSKAETFVTGISSGGATVSGLLACFPKMFKAAAIHSGPSYGLAQSLSEAQNVLRDGPPSVAVDTPCRTHDFRGNLLVIQGQRDTVVNPKHAPRLLNDFLENAVQTSVREINDEENSYVTKDFRNLRQLGRLIEVRELPHAWSGYTKNLRHPKIPTTVPFFSEIGPSATDLSWQFFLESW